MGEPLVTGSACRNPEADLFPITDSSPELDYPQGNIGKSLGPNAYLGDSAKTLMLLQQTRTTSTTGQNCPRTCHIKGKDAFVLQLVYEGTMLIQTMPLRRLLCIF